MLFPLFVSLVGLSLAASTARGPAIRKFTNLVTFGDSYTDESRLGYLQQHGGVGPPPGTELPISYKTSSGGIVWARWASIYSGAKLYNYAVSGAACSSDQIYRYRAELNGPWPGILEYEVPAFLADTKFINKSTNTNTLYTNRKADNTVYAIWIGTNDLGVGALLQDMQKPGTNITTFTECVFKAFDRIYAAGGRYFVLMNTAPLHLIPLYGPPNAGGLATSLYWPDKPSNISEISQKMLEYTVTANRIWALQAPYESLVARRYPGASLVLFDVHTLMTDVYEQPAAYLNGTDGVADVTAAYYQCDQQGKNCVTQAKGGLSGYMWYDELHPAEKVDQIIADEFVRVVGGKSEYAAYW